MILPSNFTQAMPEAAVSSSGLSSVFEPHLSTGQVRAYKPDPRAYGMADEAVKLRRSEIVIAAFAGWDASAPDLHGRGRAPRSARLSRLTANLLLVNPRPLQE